MILKISGRAIARFPPLAWAPAGGGERAFTQPLEIGIKNQKFLENLLSEA